MTDKTNIEPMPWFDEGRLVLCDNCANTGWVCENHPARPWNDGQDSPPGSCNCGAGMPCACCNVAPAGHWPRFLNGSAPIWEAYEGYLQ